MSALSPWNSWSSTLSSLNFQPFSSDLRLFSLKVDPCSCIFSDFSLGFGPFSLKLGSFSWISTLGPWISSLFLLKFLRVDLVFLEFPPFSSDVGLFFFEVRPLLLQFLLFFLGVRPFLLEAGLFVLNFELWSLNFQPFPLEILEGRPCFPRILNLSTVVPPMAAEHGSRRIPRGFP